MNIPEVDYHLDKIDCDKLTFNYLEYPEPYIQLDKFKQYNDMYDYVVIVTNDVIVKQENIDTLIKDLEDRPRVMCGCFNVDLKNNSTKLNISFDLDYNWLDADMMIGIEEVEFAGFPLMAIRWDVFHSYQFTGSHNAGDMRFCKWCKDNNIPILCNTDNRMLHLRYYGEKPINKVQSIEWKQNI